MADFTTPRGRWLAVSQRNPQADGHFVYCVLTTKIYCRPICPARLARQANVVFCDSASDAEKAGFRPCKRCEPHQSGPFINTQDFFVERACVQIEEAIKAGARYSALPRLTQLAKDAGLTISHFQRTFKKIKGVSPKEYGLLFAETFSATQPAKLDLQMLHVDQTQMIADGQDIGENTSDDSPGAVLGGEIFTLSPWDLNAPTDLFVSDVLEPNELDPMLWDLSVFEYTVDNAL